MNAAATGSFPNHNNESESYSTQFFSPKNDGKASALQIKEPLI